MNKDDFEQRLQRQPLRSIPTEWRQEILEAADVNRRNEPVRELTFAATIKLRLRELLWPCPKAWVGLAAVWLVILVLNFETKEKPIAVTKKQPPPSPEMQIVMKEQRRILAELLMERPGPREADQRKPGTPSPRSERRREMMMA